ncbi:MAG TPA: SbcC/MukB-like Walker B domain-containing protein, partial [Streptosporangiaceae bacterium]
MYEALRETAGAAVEELYRQLAEVRDELERRSTLEKSARGREQQALGDRGKAEGTRERLRAEIEEAVRARDAAVAEFQSFGVTGLLRIALPLLEVPDVTQPWAATPAVLLARAVNAGLESVDDADSAWDRIQKRVTEEHKLLADAMARHGHSAGLTLHDGIIVVDVVFQGRSHDIPGLAEALREEAEQRARLLSAREREILENHLLNEVAGTLHELISAAEAEVRAMNEELESRPTSTGMKLRLIWQQARDAPDGLDQVRHRFRQTIDAWSADDRAAVGSFLQLRIATEHAGNPAAGWAEALSAALDYRRWHEFVIQRYQAGQWRPATGPASGGERALAASVPLFAAASAHYRSAGNPHAPRLIALDEAFAGVDDDSRAKCLGLLATFDMDVAMTSEREWGCYPQVPGLGICQLARQGRGRRRPRHPVAVGRAGTPAGGTGGMTETDPKLHRLLGGEPVAWLLRRARDRLEAGRPLTGAVTLPAATPDQRRAVERLTGRAARSGASLSVSLAEVDRILRDSGAAQGGLAEAVTRLTG